ncbi:MAG TPA: hypothetical protein VLF69_00375 [Candidatus Saccharimonadales bacterium]|nr:hypothetical protein [Candidatus Saccharimonadales bacterium]
MKSKNTIELNGNLYDAITGKMLGKSSLSPSRTGGNIDGFFRARTAEPARPVAQKVTIQETPEESPTVIVRTGAARASANHAKAHKPQTSQRVAASAPPQPAVHATKHNVAKQISANHRKHHQPQPSVTLMRTAVKKPAPSFKQQATVQATLTHAVPGLIEVKHVAAHVDEGRLVRATTVETNPMVAHHGREPQKIAVGFAPLAVQPQPVQPGPVPNKPGDNTPAGAPAPQPTNNPQDIFTHALANASNFLDVREHRAYFRKHARRHVASMTAGTLALLIIAGFAFYQNSPGMQLRIAGVKAGVATRMPNFAAAGFAYNGVKANNGKLTLGFRNGQGNYQLVQQTTSWSDSDMIQDVSAVDASGNPNYTTLHAGSVTIYRFSNTNAMWVTGGKWYTVNGTNNLSDQQVRALVQNV